MLLSRHGTLAEQVARAERAEAAPGGPVRAASPTARPAPEATPPRPDLEFFNGLGGFAADGREYVTVLGEGQWTPAPWVNVVANPSFGFQVSESGGGYTWSVNSRENQLTPWSNDPVGDPPGEVLYVRDEESGELWGPTVLPIREEAWPYIARHGQGYSRFEHTLARDRARPAAVRAARRSGQGLAARDREPLRSRAAPLGHGVRRVGARRLAQRVVAARGHRDRRPAPAPCWRRTRGTASSRTAWRSPISAGARLRWTGDRTEFLGRNGTLDHPAALERDAALSGKVGAGLDPCGALQTTVELRAGRPGGRRALLGQAASVEEARALVDALPSGRPRRRPGLPSRRGGTTSSAPYR